MRFSDVAQAISGPRGSGRTYRLLAMSPKEATIVGVDKRHIDCMRKMATDMGRDDLNFATITRDAFVGRRDFSLDHFAQEALLYKAQQQIDALHEQARELQSENEKLRKSINTISTELRTLTNALSSALYP